MISTHCYYLLVDLGCFLVPFLFSFHPKLRFHRNWSSFFPALLAMMCVFITWDVWFTHEGIWGFNPKYNSGIYIAGLPLEEWLFFVCIPYACVFTYHCFGLLVRNIPFDRFFKLLAWCTAFASIAVAVIFHDRWYTFSAHLFCGLLLLVHLTVLKSAYIQRFFFMFIVVFPAFLTSNGILTGVDFWNYSFLNTNPEAVTEKIVWYDNSHNLGVRLFSMPVDDIAYGLTMLLLVTGVYESLLRRKAIRLAQA